VGAEGRLEAAGSALLSGRVAAITGAGGLIGSAVARALAAAGGAVILGYHRRRERVEELAAAIHRAGGRVLVLQGDVTDEEAVGEWAGAALRWRGRVDILVNCVGDWLDADLDEITPAQWHHLLRSNLESVLLVTRALLPAMRAAGFGRIINFAYSDADHLRGRRGLVPYAIAKAGVLILSRSLARREAAHGITVNVISPGIVATEDGRLEGYRRLVDRLPSGRPTRAEEIAALVLFLAGDQAAQINGANILVSGGWQA